MSTTIKLGLLGNNLGRSRAKNLHELLGERYGLDVTYQPLDLVNHPGPVSIKGELERCRDNGFRGVNVTHPYKREAFDCVNTMAPFPRGLTSINTVLFNPAGMEAANTDFSGCCRAFRSKFGDSFNPGRVLMLGAGGVGIAIACALQRCGAEELVLFDLDERLAQDLARQLTTETFRVRVAGTALIGEMEQADGLVNATPIGMFQYPGNPFPADGFGNQRWAFDAVYTPEKTEFIGECRKHDLETVSGFYLFLYQGLDAFEHFTGIKTDATVVEPLFLQRFPLE